MANVQVRGTLDYLQMSSCVLNHVQGDLLTHSTFTSINSLAEELAHCHNHLASITHSERESAGSLPSMNLTLLPQSTPAAGGTEGMKISGIASIFTHCFCHCQALLFKTLEQDEPSVLCRTPQP